MKKWISPKVSELKISATAQGGQNINNIDNVWTDIKTGDAYLSLGSGGNTVGDEFEVIKKDN